MNLTMSQFEVITYFLGGLTAIPIYVILKAIYEYVKSELWK